MRLEERGCAAGNAAVMAVKRCCRWFKTPVTRALLSWDSGLAKKSCLITFTDSVLAKRRALTLGEKRTELCSSRLRSVRGAGDNGIRSRRIGNADSADHSGIGCHQWRETFQAVCGKSWRIRIQVKSLILLSLSCSQCDFGGDVQASSRSA